MSGVQTPLSTQAYSKTHTHLCVARQTGTADTLLYTQKGHIAVSNDQFYCVYDMNGVYSALVPRQVVYICLSIILPKDASSRQLQTQL